mmetsp:Transcript_18614/g.44047  ORF Transcript_18614/g.44047 Transcript_18614/m.44047 type:complete len:436 (+) Transcript_18614:973-2280(+)
MALEDLHTDRVPRGLLLQHRHKVFSPHSDGQLGDLHIDEVINLMDGPNPLGVPLPILPLHLSAKSSIRRRQFLHSLALDETFQASHDGQRVVVGALGGPARADALEAVHQHEREDGQKRRWLDEVPFLHLGLHNVHIFPAEDVWHQRSELSLDVPRAAVHVGPVQPGAEHSFGLEEVNVVGAHKVLRQSNNHLYQGFLAVVIAGGRRDQAHDLGDPLLRLQVPHGPPEHFPLRGLQPIQEQRDGTHAVVGAEMDQLLIQEVFIGSGGFAIVQLLRRVVAGDPQLAVIRTRRLEDFGQGVGTALPIQLQVYDMLVHVGKVLQRLLASGGGQALVVLRPKAFGPLGARVPLPIVEVTLAKELQRSAAISWEDLDQRCGKALHKVGLHLQQGGPQRSKEVQHEACDVVPIQVLVREDHDLLISQRSDLLFTFEDLAPA